MYDKTTLEAFDEREKKRPEKPFLHQPFGELWETYPWGETGQWTEIVKIVAAAKTKSKPTK